MTSFSAALRGATILKRYNHPDDWRDGNTGDDFRLRGHYVLYVEEIQRGNGATVSDIEARVNAEAIVAWARYSQLIDNCCDTLIINDPDTYAYVAVPIIEWDTVLQMLRAL